MPPNNRSLKYIIVFLSVLLIASSLYLYGQLKLQDETITTLSGISENQKQTITLLEQNISRLEQNLSVTEKSLKNETQTRLSLEKEIINLTTVAKSDYAVMAVDENDKGHLIPLEIIIKSGKGNLFLNVANVIVDETLQSSAQTAILVAREVSRKSLSDKDVLINIEAPVQEQKVSISGGSAGAAMTLAAMAAIQGKTLRNDVLITGTIREDHTIGRIGSPRAKALAAKENGAVMFLVPAGQVSEVGDAGIEVRGVATIEAAAGYALE
ncbi:MAG: S16 family serine protease [Candidatus Methanoperedens sp.]|nr:S16 family serine protease [Candidatus Methanoperedens sp.]